jgi:hypothetical protein
LSPFLVDDLFLNCACKSRSAISALKAQKGKSMQNGSMMRTERYGGPDVKPPDLTELHVPFCAYKKISGCPKTMAIRQTGPQIGAGVVPFCACAKSGRSP